ncbi:hypothetical protein ANN_27099 [Periplaneta americana]|uniref:THAP-type domain-containing protein n=1 Tax=Periplaneta americana TaxID=6978 RepID=A0ABQ8RXD6_PERAM|nr:hypothetical protein ANN_27099 [Periplaneta americana]
MMPSQFIKEKQNKNVLLYSTMHSDVEVKTSTKRVPETIRFHKWTKFAIDVIARRHRNIEFVPEHVNGQTEDKSEKFYSATCGRTTRSRKQSCSTEDEDRVEEVKTCKKVVEDSSVKWRNVETRQMCIVTNVGSVFVDPAQKKKILGPIQENNTWRILNNKELRDIYKDPDITAFIRSRRLRWLGHVLPRYEDSLLRKASDYSPRCKRPLGRPRFRWHDQVYDNLSTLGGRQEDAENRDDWRYILNEAKKPLRSDRSLTEKDRVCDVHFNNDMIVKVDSFVIQGKTVELKRDKWKLTTDAVPHQFPGIPKYFNFKPSKRKAPKIRNNQAHQQKRKKTEEPKIISQESNAVSEAVGEAD